MLPFGMLVDHSMSQPVHDKLSDRGMVTSCDPF